MTTQDQTFPQHRSRSVGVSLHPTGMTQVLGNTRLPWPVAIYMVAVITPILFNIGPLLMSGLRAFLLIMIIPLSYKLFRGRYGHLLWTDIFFFLHIFWALLALAVNNPDRVVQNIGSAALEFLGGYLIGRAYIRKKEDFAAMIRFFMLLVICMLPLALFETMTGRPIIIETIRKIPGIYSVGIVNIEARMGLERVQALFAHPIHYGLFCSGVFSLTFVGMKGITSTPVRWVVSGIVLVSVFFSLSSGALLPVILQSFLILWALIFDKVQARWLILLGLIALMYVAIDLLSNRTPIKVFMSYATFSAHTAYWRSLIFEWGMVNVWNNPIFGLGLNDWIRPWYMRSGSMDNFWLVMAVRYGIPGFLLIAIGYFYTLWTIARKNLDGDRITWQFRRAWMFTFIGLSLTLCTVHIWTAVYSFVFFLFGAGMWFNYVSIEDMSDETLDGSSNPKQARGITYQRPKGTKKVQGTLSPATQRPGAVKYTRFVQKQNSTAEQSTSPKTRNRRGSDQT